MSRRDEDQGGTEKDTETEISEFFDPRPEICINEEVGKRNKQKSETNQAIFY